MSKSQRADAGDERSVKEFKKVLKLQREREVEDFRRILATEYGRAFIWRLLLECGIFQAPATHELETFRQLGRKDIELWVINEVFTSDMKAFTLMMLEANERDSKGVGKDD